MTAHEFEEQYSDLMGMLLEESDRACVLIAAAAINDEITSLLKSTLKKASDCGKKDLKFFFDVKQNGPLSSFGVQVRFALALGLIPRTLRPALDTIRDLRNSFAHVAKSVELSNVNAQEIVNSVEPAFQEAIQRAVDFRDNFVLAKLLNPEVRDEDRKEWGKAAQHVSKAKIQFVTAAVLVWAYVRLSGYLIETMEDSLSLPLFP